MYILPQRRSRRLSLLLGVLPVPTPGVMPRRFAALAQSRYRGLSGLGSLPTTNSFSVRRITPALAAARMENASRMRLTRRVRRSGGFAGLGDDTDIDWVTGLPCDDPRANCGASTTTAPSSGPSGQPSGAVVAAYKNALAAAQPSQSPLDYVSPNAAKAAGLNPAAVDAAWAKGLSRFPTPQDAVNAGINAGVVNSLWAQSRAASSPVSSVTDWLAQNWKTVAVVGGVAVVLRGMGGRR